VLIQFFVPAFYLLPVDWGRLAAGEGIFGQAGPVTWQGMLLLGWLLASVGIGIIYLGRAIRARRLAAGAREANNLMRGVLWYCRTCMGVRGETRLRVSRKLARPAAWGLFRPVILVPHNLAPTLGARHLRSALLHELAHIKRRDLWVNVVQRVLQVIYFYNPMVWLANGRIRVLREQAVDEMVVRVMGEKGLWYQQARVDVSRLAFRRRTSNLDIRAGKVAADGRRHIENRRPRKKVGVGS
jgi:beta-lactamase regulating signal transducer with metallopeptidase domain